MSKTLSIASEHLYEKRWLMLGFGLLPGIFGYAITQLLEVIDLSAMMDLFTYFPELQELLDLFGDLASHFFAQINV